MNPENLVSIRVWGDFACFTRPEVKVERIRYPRVPALLEMVFDQTPGFLNN